MISSYLCVEPLSISNVIILDTTTSSVDISFTEPVMLVGTIRNFSIECWDNNKLVWTDSINPTYQDPLQQVQSSLAGDIHEHKVAISGSLSRNTQYVNLHSLSGFMFQIFNFLFLSQVHYNRVCCIGCRAWGENFNNCND